MAPFQPDALGTTEVAPAPSIGARGSSSQIGAHSSSGAQGSTKAAGALGSAEVAPSGNDGGATRVDREATVTTATDKNMLANEITMSLLRYPTHPRLGTSCIELPLCPGPRVPHHCGSNCNGILKGARERTTATVLIPRASVGRLIGIGGHVHRALQRATGCRIRTRPVADEDAIAFDIDALCAQRGPAIALQTRCATYISQLALGGRG